MNKTNVAKVMAMGVAVSTFMAPAVVHADVVISDGNLVSPYQKAGSGASVTLEDGKTNDLTNPGGADVTNGPKISVKRDKFLIEKGANFDFKNSLGLSVVDSKDGDLTSKFQFPQLDTTQAKNFTKTITAKNSEGKTSTKTLVFRIVDIADSIDVESKEALQTMDLSKVINSETEGLTVKLGSIKDGSFVAKVSDGTNTLEKEINYDVKQGTTGKPSTPDGDSTQLGDGTSTAPQDGTLTDGTTTDGTTSGSTTTGGTTTDGTTTQSGSTSTDSTTSGGSANPGASTALPQTGVASTTAGIAAGIAAISGAILKKRK